MTFSATVRSRPSSRRAVHDAHPAAPGEALDAVIGEDVAWRELRHAPPLLAVRQRNLVPGRHRSRCMRTLRSPCSLASPQPSPPCCLRRPPRAPPRAVVAGRRASAPAATRSASPSRARRSPRDGPSALAFYSKTGALHARDRLGERPLRRGARRRAHAARATSRSRRRPAAPSCSPGRTATGCTRRSGRRPGAGSCGARYASGPSSEINGVQVAADPQGGWVIAAARLPARPAAATASTACARSRSIRPAARSAPSRTSAPASSGSTRAPRRRSRSRPTGVRC